MVFTKYVCPRYEEPIISRIAVERIKMRNLESAPRDVEESFATLLSYLSEQPVNLALVDGVLIDTPGSKQATYAAESERDGFAKPVRLSVQTVLPFTEKVVPVSPLLQIVRYDRLLHGEEHSPQQFLTAYWENDSAGNLYELDTDGKTRPVGVDVLGRPFVKPKGISARDLRDTLGGLRQIIEKMESKPLPFSFRTQPFYLFGKSETDDADEIKDFLRNDALKFSKS